MSRKKIIIILTASLVVLAIGGGVSATSKLNGAGTITIEKGVVTAVDKSGNPIEIQTGDIKDIKNIIPLEIKTSDDVNNYDR